MKTERKKLSAAYLRFAPLSWEKVDATKSSWRGWLSWGKSQTQETANDLKRRANEMLEAWGAQGKRSRIRTRISSGVRVRQGKTFAFGTGLPKPFGGVESKQ